MNNTNTTIKNKSFALGAKHLAVGVGFAATLATSVGLGLHSRKSAHAMSESDPGNSTSQTSQQGTQILHNNNPTQQIGKAKVTDAILESHKETREDVALAKKAYRAAQAARQAELDKAKKTTSKTNKPKAKPKPPTVSTTARVATQTTPNSPTGSTGSTGGQSTTSAGSTTSANTHVVVASATSAAKPKTLEAGSTLPETGPGDVLGLFAGTSAVGYIGHKIMSRRRNREA